MKASVTQNIPARNSKSEDWIQWHKDLKSEFGSKVANSLWVKAWGLRGSSAANTSDLRTYLGKEGISISESSWDKVVDTTKGVTDFFGGIITMGKIGAYAAIGILLLGGAMIVYNVAKSPGETIGKALKAAV